MRYSDNYNLKLPQRGVDRANVDDLDDNFEIIDGALADDRQISLLMYDSTSTYNTGDIVGYENPTTHRIRAFRCLEDNVTGSWDATKWAQTTLAAEIENGGGGTDVEANPSGTATADLEKLRVGQTIYGLPTDMTGATSQDAGAHGLVPAPSAGDEGKVLYGDGTWKTPQSAPSNLDDLGDVTLTTPTEGQILEFDGEEWVNTDAPDVDVTKTASGNPIEISDGANAPLVKCVTQITGYQEGSGTPSPDNIRPIVAYTEGKIEVGSRNLCNQADKTTSGAGYVIGTNAPDYINTDHTVFPIGTYTFSFNVVGATSGSQAQVIFYVNDTTSAGSKVQYVTTDGRKSFTITANKPFAKIQMYYNGSSGGQFSKFQLERGEELHDYEPYTSTTHTTTYPSAIYRGSEDVVNGEAVTEWGMIDSYAGETLPGEWISDRDEYAPGTTPTTGAQVAYKLATPTTSSVTPTNLPIKSLSGYNHIESSTGEMEIEYIAKAFSPITELVDSQISALQKMMELMLTSARETEMVASANYTTGTLIVACGALYKATTAISSGASLVVGTNITPTTIAAEIAALA